MSTALPLCEKFVPTFSTLKPNKAWWEQYYNSNQQELLLTQGEASSWTSPDRPYFGFGIVDTVYKPVTGYIDIIDRRNAKHLLPIIEGAVEKWFVLHSGLIQRLIIHGKTVTLIIKWSNFSFLLLS